LFLSIKPSEHFSDKQVHTFFFCSFQSYLANSAVVSQLSNLSADPKPVSVVIKKKKKNNQKQNQVPVAHAYNPSYSGGKDQEDHGSKPVWANSLRDPISKETITKKDWQSGLWYRP
jgi:hypothetical protein